jgi:diguanylate cyclase (GGDEF)-like protein/PAS domain S-box-containing protein
MKPTPFCDQILTYVQTLSATVDLTEAKLLEYLVNVSIKLTQSQSGFICIVDGQGRLKSPFVTTGQMDMTMTSHLTTYLKNVDFSLPWSHANDYAIIPIAFENDTSMVIGVNFLSKSNADDAYAVSIKVIAEVGYRRLEHLKTIHRLRKSQRVFNLTFEQVGSGVCQTDLDGFILDANQNYCDILGYTHEELINLRVKDLTYPDDWEIDKVYKNQLFNYEIPYFSMDKRYYRKDGSLIWVTITVTLMRGDAFEEDFLIGVVQDISKQKAAEALLIQNNENLERLVRERTLKLEELNEQLMIANTIDPLTSLYNRRFISSKIGDEILRYNRTKSPFCLILTDIDYFKDVNDQFGHDCGDEVLQTISRLLRKEIRSIDTLARWGGEEFLLLLPNTMIDDAHLIAERIRMKVEAHPFTYEGATFNLTMTLGLAMYQDNLTMKALVKKADTSLYEGKQLGRNCVRGK